MRGLIIAIIIVSVLGASGWYFLHFLPADFIYGVEADFTELPSNDEKLEQWVQKQPGVFRASVQRKSAGTDMGLVVIVGMTQNLWYDPPFPDLTTKCAELGYRGQKGPFLDPSR